MSVYTTEVRFLCEQFASEALGSQPSSCPIDDVIAAAEPRIFDFTYTLWEGCDIHEVNRAILEHFYFREIGLETYGLWKTFLKRRILERSPYWTKLYPTTILEYNYLNDYEVEETLQRMTDSYERGSNQRTSKEENTRKTLESVNGSTTLNSTVAKTYEESRNGTENSTSNETANNTQVHSDFPQAPIGVNGDYASTQDVQNGTNGTTVNGETNNTANSSGSDKTTGTNTQSSETNGNIADSGTSSATTEHSINKDAGENMTRTEKGRRGGKTPTQLILEYRAAILDIMPVIMEDLEDLFMQIY